MDFDFVHNRVRRARQTVPTTKRLPGQSKVPAGGLQPYDRRIGGGGPQR